MVCPALRTLQDFGTVAWWLQVSLAPNRFVPTGFKEENFHADGTFELISYNLNAGPAFAKDNFSFSRPLGDDFSRAQRRGYFAAVSFVANHAKNKNAIPG